MNHQHTLPAKEAEFAEQHLKHLEATTNFTPNEDTRRRARYAAGATTVEFELLPSQTNANGSEGRQDHAKIKVTYEHAFFSPVIGRFFGEPSFFSDGVYVRKLEKEIEIPLEIARSKDGTLGLK